MDSSEKQTVGHAYGAIRLTIWACKHGDREVS
jgi:hypothetical protein